MSLWTLRALETVASVVAVWVVSTYLAAGGIWSEASLAVLIASGMVMAFCLQREKALRRRAAGQPLAHGGAAPSKTDVPEGATVIAAIAGLLNGILGLLMALLGGLSSFDGVFGGLEGIGWYSIPLILFLGYRWPFWWWRWGLIVGSGLIVAIGFVVFDVLSWRLSGGDVTATDATDFAVTVGGLAAYVAVFFVVAGIAAVVRRSIFAARTR